MTSFSPLTASGGTTPYTYSYTGTLPTGLGFNASTGVVTGTPTATHSTASLVFSVKDSNNVEASTTSSVSFTVAAGTGVSFSATLGVYNSVANTHFTNGRYVVGGEDSLSNNFIKVWIDSTGSEASFAYAVFGAPHPDSLQISFDPLNTRPGIMCGVGSSFTYNGLIPDCSSIGITIDRAAGVITFASTPLRYGYYATMAGPVIATATGSLTFTPF